MKKILFFLPKDLHEQLDIFKLIISTKQEFPTSHLGVLNFWDTENISHLINQIDSHHCINQKELTKNINKRFYSNRLSLESLKESVSIIEQHDWDTIYNFNTDSFSLNIASYLVQNKNTKFKGVNKDSNNNISFSNRCSLLLYCSETIKGTFLKRSLLLHKAAGIQNSATSISLVNNSKHLQKLKNTFNIISNNSPHKKYVIGLKISNHLLTNNVSRSDRLINIVKEIDKNSAYDIVLLTKTNSLQTKYAKKINSFLKNKKTILETDDIATSSVLNSIDCLITSDPLTIQMSVACNRNYIQLKELDGNCINVINKVLIEKNNLKSLKPIDEIKRYISKSLIDNSKKSDHRELKEIIKSISFHDLKSWTTKEHHFIESVSKIILTSLRLTHPNNKRKNEQNKIFVENLQLLYSLSKKDSIIKIPLLCFKNIIENNLLNNIEQNTKLLTKSLYLLKKDMSFLMAMFLQIQNMAIKHNVRSKQLKNRTLNPIAMEQLSIL